MSELRSRSLREDVEALRDTMAARFKAEHSPGYKKYDLARMELDEILRNHPPEPGQPAAYKKCAECKGKGWDWLAGAPAHETNKYPCEKCNGTGKVLEQPADFIEVDGIHVDTQWVRDIRGKLAETDFKLQRAEAGQPAAVPVDKTCTKHNGFGHSDDCIYCNAESAAGQSEPVAWMHDQNGRVDVIHDSVRQLWLKVGQKYSAQFCREIVPCMVEHYTIPLYTHTIPAAPAVPDGYCIMPRTLTAENGAKALLMGEFNAAQTITCPLCGGDDDEMDVCDCCEGEGEIVQSVPISWTTIKEIYSKAVKHFAASPNQQGTQELPDIQAMVDRFLGWKLPEDFAPDGGISFKQSVYGNIRTQPTGTNLLTADQAKAMFEYVLAAPEKKPA